MANKEEAESMDDHENEDEIEEEQQILQCFDQEIQEFFEEVKSQNPQTQVQDDEELQNDEKFFFEEHLRINNPVVSDTQKEIAKDLFENKILENTPKEFWKSWKYFDFYIVVPYFVSLG